MTSLDPSASNVVVYASPFCGYCGAAKRLLKSKGVDFIEIDVLFNPERRHEMVNLSGRQTVPQIFISGQHVGGYKELADLEARGELDALLAEEPMSSDPQ